jgi:hypothetical protein
MLGKPVKKRRFIPSPAMVVAVIALFVALGGVGAYAASHISGSQIKNNSISLKKLNRHARIATVNLPANGPGQPGAEGKEGSAGHNGSNGADGKAGENGKNGEKGEQGNTGSQGSAGSQGPEGQQGVPGTPGAPGSPGSTGTQGPQGEPGLNSGEPRVVTASNLQGWRLAPEGDNEETSANGTLSFTTPPVPSALGVNALQMEDVTGRSVVAYAPFPGSGLPNSGTDKPLLKELTTADYESLIATQPQADLDIALQIEVTGSTSTHFSSGYTTVVYEPYQNGESETLNQWHRHYVLNGKVWSTQAASSANPSDCTQSVPCPFSQFVSENPNALVQTVKFRIGQNSGNGWSGFVGDADDLRLGFDGDFTRYDLGG